MRDDRNRGPGRWIIVIVILIFTATVCAFLLLRQDRVSVKTARVTMLADASPMTILSASGYVTPRKRATVAAKITGQVKEMLVEEGMVVTAEQVLARLDDAEARARYEAARAQLDVAEASCIEIRVNLDLAGKNLKRIQDLYADDMASREQLDTQETTVASLKAQLEVAGQQVDAAKKNLQISSQNLEDHVIRAPFDGVAVSKDAQVGEMVSPVSAGGGFTRTGISTIVDMQSLEIEVDVNESYIARVYPDQPVSATLDAYPDWQIPAHVRTIIPTADRQKATVKVRISFDKLDPRILPDMGVKVSFQEAGQAEGEKRGVLVPSSAVVERDGRTVVFVVQGQEVERRAVSVARQTPEGTQVTAGLKGSETVVVNVPARLQDGDKIDIQAD